MEMLKPGDPRIDAKKKILTELKALARGKMAEALKSKFRPEKRAEEAPEPEPEPTEPPTGDDDKDDEEKLLALLGQ